LEADCPDVELIIHSGQNTVELGRNGPQAAVRLGPGHWPGTRTDKLADEYLLPVCTPAVLQHDGPVAAGAWPHRHRLIHNSVDPWTLWSNPPTHAARERVLLDDSLACVLAAESGLGLALVRASVAAQGLARGSLVAAGPRQLYRYAFYFVTPRGVADPAPVISLRRWLKRQMRQ
jgi:LysR family transcriptional regulator, glycine cleavage system transcriptional activator